MKLKIKKLSPNAVLPSKAHSDDGGMDLTAITKIYDTENNVVVMGTGLVISIPPGHVGLLFPRSSIYKTPFILANSVGVLDAGFLGEVKFMFRPIISPRDRHTKEYEVGQRIGQLVIVELPKFEIEEVTDLDETDRGTGGFGSSGS